VSLAVGVILFEAGLKLSLSEVAIGIHRVVERLVSIGAIVTGLAIAATVTLLFSGVSNGVALLIGAILIVSGPTVVLPLLSFIRPQREVRALLKWEGVLIDPIGAIVGVLVFQALNTGGAHHGWRPGEFFGSLAVGALVGIGGAALLYGLLREVHLNQ